MRYLQRKTTSSNTRSCYVILLTADENAHGSKFFNNDIANTSDIFIPTVIDTLRKKSLLLKRELTAFIVSYMAYFSF